MIAATFIGTQVIAQRCKAGQLMGGLTVLVATVLVSAIYISAILVATAFGCRNIVNAFTFAIAGWVIAGREDVVPGIRGPDGRSRARWVTEIRQNLLRLHLTLAQSGEVVGDGLFLVQADLTGIGTDEAFVKHAAGKLVKVFLFQCAEHARADLRGVRDGVERESALFALLAKFFPEGSQGRLRRAQLHFRPHPDGNNHRRIRTLMPEVAE